MKNKKGVFIIKTKLLIFAIMLLSITNSVFGDTIKEQKEFAMDIEISGDNDYKMFAIPDEVYENVKNINSISIKAQDEDVPYFVLDEKEFTYITTETYSSEFVSDFTKNNIRYFDFKVNKIEENRDLYYTDVDLKTSENFYAYNVILYGGFDGVNWELIGDFNIFSTDESSNETIKFNNQKKYEYLRFCIIDYKENFSIVEIIPKNVENNFGAKVIATKETDLEFQVSEEEKNTIIFIDSKKFVGRDLLSLEIETKEELYSREIFTNDLSIKNDKITNLGGNTFNLEINRDSMVNENIRINILNFDDKPLNIERVTLKTIEKFVLFKEYGQDCSLVFDNYTTDSKRYDIVNFKNEILNYEIDEVKVSNLTTNIILGEEKIEPDMSLFLNILLVILVCVFVFIIFKNGLKKK